MDSIVMLLVVVAVFYFLIIRPENKRKKQAEDMRNTLKKGDQVITIGGVMGKVVSVAESSFVLETSEDRVRIEFAKWALSNNTTAEAAAAEEAKAKKEAKLKEKEEKKAASAKAKDLEKKIEE